MREKWNKIGLGYKPLPL